MHDLKSNERTRAILALSLIPGLGDHRVKKLALGFDDPEKIFSKSKTELRSVDGIGEASALSVLSFKDWKSVDEILDATEKVKAQIITIVDDAYPRLLRQIYDPPALFWIKGNPDALSKPGVAVIGTRNPSPYGKKTARKITTALVEKDLCIFSGLAYGVDGIAHQAALDADGVTVAVLGSGIDMLYPREHTDIANQIVKSGGAVITEFPLGTKPDSGNFPVRNRIVSGMSLGVFVVESAMQGGSMITADLALDQNREVFALPHTIENLNGSGCNFLIKSGSAKLVQSVDDILDELPLDFNSDQINEPASTTLNTPKKPLWRDLDLDDESKLICENLEKQDFQIDDLSDEIGVSTSKLLVALLQLEMQGLVSQKAGKIFSLK